MTWTHDKPTQAGYYWYRRHANQQAQLLLVEVDWRPRYEGDMIASYTKHSDEPRALGVFEGEWQGPLDVPQ